MKKSGLSPWLLAAIHALRARGAAMVAAARRDWRRLAWHGGRVGLYTSSAVGLVAVVGTLALWARPTWRADLASRVGPLLEAATGTANAAGQSANGAADAKLSPSDSAMMAQAAQHVPSAAVLAAYIPNQRVAAANGQFLLVEREAYRRLGGHASVHDRALEDVELAFLAKRRKVGIRFRYADDAVSTRMYRNTAAMVEGWTKNLALLFNNALALAVCAGGRLAAGACRARNTGRHG